MIMEHISKFDISPLPAILTKGINILRNTSFDGLEDGRYEVDGPDLFFEVQSYETLDRNAVKSEIHKKYCDIQFVHQGKEAIGWASASSKIDLSSFNAQKDIALFTPPQNEIHLLMEEGMFVFFTPYEIHRPRLDWSDGVKSKVRKIVVKINSERLLFS